MYKASRILEKLTPLQLDEYLARGWFRMNQSIFTTQFLQEGVQFRDAIWLRQQLKNFVFPKWFLKLQDKNIFRVEMSGFPVTTEHELLYQKYRKSRIIDSPVSLEAILYGDSSENIYNTKIINLYVDDELAGAGFFDIGEKSAAGIVNYYDPLYSRYSPGKFLFLLAVQYCQQQGFEFFYPGYFAPGNSHFDYKLDFHKPSLEYFEVAFDSWVPFRFYNEHQLPTRIIRHHLMELIPELEEADHPACFIHNANYFFIKNSKWDSPFAIYVLPTNEHPWQFAITYNTNNNHYYIFDCTDTNGADEIFEEEGSLVCFQFLNLKHPVEEAFSHADVVKKLNALKSLFKREK